MPPVVVKLIAPLQTLLQVKLVVLILMVIEEGCAIVNTVLIGQAEASVIATVYVFAHNPELTVPEPAGDQVAVYGDPFPPVATTVAAPLHEPKHKILCVCAVIVNAGGCVIVTTLCVVQLLKSFTKIV